jgi:xanthine dehydrogenase accessory factor
VENVDLAVLKTAIEWIGVDGNVVLATVAKTWGSSPRPAGSIMVWRADGQFEGSLSGGCIEQELMEQFSEVRPGKPTSISYGITKEQAVSRGLPCGGEVTVVVETLESADQSIEILARLARRERVQRVLDMESGNSMIETPQELARTDLTGKLFQLVFEPKWRVLVIGAGQLSAYVTRFADTLGYDVLVCDPRENYRHSWLADDISLSSEMPDDFIIMQQCDRQTAVVALTHDPKLDDLAIMEALNSPSFYVGALGSSRTNGARRERLYEHFGLTKEQLEFMSGPIGLDLNTRTASEIALAIMTEITARRNGVKLSSERMKLRDDPRGQRTLAAEP